MFAESIGLSTEQIIIAIIIIAVIVFIVYKLFKSEHMDNVDFSEENKTVDTLNKTLEELEKEDGNTEADGITDNLDIQWTNKADGKYKSSSYLEGERGNDYKELSLQDEYETQMAKSIDYSAMNSQDKFIPNDNGDGNYAPYTSSKSEFTVKELMDSDKLLPQEENKGWFDTVEDPIKVKNRHLININRPIGIDTVASSLKNACRDLRGNVPCPKYTISPFLNSSIEPDLNTVGFCNANPYN